MHFLIGLVIVLGIIVFLLFTPIGRIIGGVFLVLAVILAIVAASNNADTDRKRAQEHAAEVEAARAKQAQWDALTPAQQQKIRDDAELKEHAWRGEVPCKPDILEIANVRRFATAQEFAYHPRVNWALKATYVGASKGMSSLGYNESLVEKEADRLRAVYAAVMAGKTVPVSWCPKISGGNPPQYSPDDPDPLMHISLFRLSADVEITLPPLPPFIRR